MTPSTIAAAMSEAQKRILDESFGQSETETPYLSFKHLAERSGLDIGVIRPAVRELAALGLMHFERGLMTDEGAMYGSGYCLTPLGLAVRQHLQEHAK